MEKTLRILGFTAIAGAVAIVVGQGLATDSQGRRLSGRVQGTGQEVARAGEAQAAIVASAPRSTLQNVLLWHFSNLQNAAIEGSKANGKSHLVDDIIKVNCYFTLAAMRPDQQKHEMEAVWQVSSYVPNDPGWAAVCRAPSMVQALLEVDASVSKKVQAKWDELTDEFMKPYREAIHRAAATPGFDKMTSVEKNQLIQRESDKVNAGRPITQRSSSAAQRSRRVVDFARPLMTTPQRQEFDRLLAAYDLELAGVLAGKRPTFLTP